MECFSHTKIVLFHFNVWPPCQALVHFFNDSSVMVLLSSVFSGHPVFCGETHDCEFVLTGRKAKPAILSFEDDQKLISGLREENSRLKKKVTLRPRLSLEIVNVLLLTFDL